MSAFSSREGDGLLRAVCVPREQSPKVEVKSRHSLYIISYSDVPAVTRSRSRSRLRSADGSEGSGVDAASKCRELCVSLYIDIPTIDYYNDELRDNRLSRFNKRFKLHLLRESIFQSFTNGNDAFWNQLMENVTEKRVKKCTISISSSGSLRYVETVKFLIEACYDKLAEYVEQNKVDLRFKLEVTPTSHKWFTTFLSKQIIERELVEFVELGTNSKISESSTTPFKKYYAQLNAKFPSHNQVKRDSKKFDSIVIITNSTGVKALLTILSDRPLTSYIVQESIDALHDNGLRKKDSQNTIDGSEDETPLKRESSSLLSFQNSLLTSNKDKSVRIRSRSLNQRVNRIQAAQNDEILLNKNSLRDSPTPRSSLANETQLDVNVDEGDLDDLGEDYGSFDDEEEEEDDDDEEEDNEDGLSFSVPSKLSRSGSSDALSSSMQYTRPTRFRSLSLMNPEQKGSFALGPTDDEASSVDGSKIANIYIHDGEFEETDSVATRKNKKKVNKALISRQSSSNGLIPPEFYSRISSPCTSASSSTSSLQNLNMAPGTFSKWLGPDSSATTTTNSQKENFHPLFEKNLITKSFEETRNKSSMNLFSTLMGATPDKNPLALNFKSNKSIPPSEVQVMDEEDRLMSGYHNGNNNYSTEEISEDDTRSTSTVVPDKFGFGGSIDRDIDKDNRSVSEQPKLGNSLRNLNLNLKLYDDTEEIKNPKKVETDVTPEVKSGGAENVAKPKYKKAITLDLYGDEDLDNAGGWILGGNAR